MKTGIRTREPATVLDAPRVGCAKEGITTDIF